ncbi:proteasome activator pa28 REG alpha/beta subunit [Sistotremastrum niveocremeum HHB9708]|nr:proteasome activator pa28 REG alpha/beta subunit [Sistotremastrum niveocremeum HHB9708]
MPSSHFHISHAAKSTDTTVHHSLGDPSIDPRKPKKRKLEDHETADDAHFTVYPSYVTANRQLQVVLKHVKDECDELVSLCDTVTLWVNLSMPRIEDGDNFGVQIQEEVLSELSKSQEAAYNTRDGVRTHHLARAKICSKMIKYPHLEDYPLALAEHDEKQYYFARQHLIDIRNIYAVLTDILHKNIAKIRSPKGNNSVGLY